MTIMFQYKGKAYAFTSVDEVLLDLDYLKRCIDETNVPSMPLTPEEVTAYLQDRKKNQIPQYNPFESNNPIKFDGEPN
jgi:hypothetical protein